MSYRAPACEGFNYVSCGLITVTFIAIPSLIRWTFTWWRPLMVIKVAEEILQEYLSVYIVFRKTGDLNKINEVIPAQPWVALNLSLQLDEFLIGDRLELHNASHQRGR